MINYNIYNCGTNCVTINYNIKEISVINSLNTCFNIFNNCFVTANSYETKINYVNFYVILSKQTQTKQKLFTNKTLRSKFKYLCKHINHDIIKLSILDLNSNIKGDFLTTNEIKIFT